MSSPPVEKFLATVLVQCRNKWNVIIHLIEILSLVVLNVFQGNMLLRPVWIYHALMRSFFTIASRAHGRRKGGKPLPGFWKFQQKRVVFCFEWDKPNLTTFGPHLEKIPLRPTLEKILPMPMAELPQWDGRNVIVNAIHSSSSKDSQNSVKD